MVFVAGQGDFNPLALAQAPLEVHGGVRAAETAAENENASCGHVNTPRRPAGRPRGPVPRDRVTCPSRAPAPAAVRCDRDRSGARAIGRTLTPLDTCRGSWHNLPRGSRTRSRSTSGQFPGAGRTAASRRAPAPVQRSTNRAVVIRHPFRLARPYLLRAALSAVVFACATPAASQPFQVLGPSECINCHDHENQKTWWQREDGPPPNGHINALNKMEDLRTPDLAAAIGLADPYDSNGPCVRCHATVYKGEAYNGVSCESCHGPGSGYLEIHQEEDSRT